MSDQSRTKRILLLTGAPGIGKTTLVRKVAGTLADLRIRGFTTEEIRERGRRRGFLLETFDGGKATLAHVDIKSPHRVGRYGVDVDMMDRMTDRTLRPDRSTELFLIDEIGKMECFSSKFVAAVRALMDSEARVIATISLKGSEFIKQVKQHPQAELWDITKENRDKMVERILAWLGQG